VTNLKREYERALRAVYLIEQVRGSKEAQG
jgi:hypothetical protein